jgi:hypothetical protein
MRQVLHLARYRVAIKGNLAAPNLTPVNRRLPEQAEVEGLGIEEYMNRILEKYKLDTRKVPLDVQEKASDIIGDVERGRNLFMNFKAQRLRFNRNIISVSVKNKWRLLADDSTGEIVWTALLPHEAYNKLIRRM